MYKIENWLSFKAPRKIVADRMSNFLKSFFKENKTWHFMWIICLADDSHEMSRLIFSEKYNKKIKMSSPAVLLAL